MTDTPLLVPALGAVYAALAPWAEAALRFAVGAAMVPHGMRMCLGYFKGTGGPIDTVQGVAALYDRKGFQPGWFWAYGTVLTQFVAAPCVALGLFTRPMALPLFALLALSAYDHAKYDGWFWNRMGIEYPGHVGARRAVFPCQRRRQDFARPSAAGLRVLRSVHGGQSCEKSRPSAARSCGRQPHRRQRRYHRRVRPCQHAASEQARPLPDLPLAFARGGRGIRHLRIHASTASR